MITVLFACHNGQRTLPGMLAALESLIPPPGGWELIAVDNRSGDSTRAILEAHAGRLPLTILSEPRQGKSIALNAAIGHVRGDLVVLTDDDVIPEPDWLVAYRACADANPDHALFGGAILPAWEKPPPQWVLDWVPLGSTFTLLEGEVDGPCPADRIWGPNMACRRSVFEAGHRFCESLGPTPGARYAMGQDTEFALRLAAAGHRPLRCAGARVRHQIEARCLEEAWILRRAVRLGIGVAQMERLPHAATGLTAPRRSTWRHLADYLLFLAAGAVLGPGPRTRRRFSVLWRRNFAQGVLTGRRTVIP